jgi:heme exporter protein CcmD
MEVFAMGGYGAYVWSSFILCTVVLVICDWRARRRQKMVYRDIEVRIKALGDEQ